MSRADERVTDTQLRTTSRLDSRNDVDERVTDTQLGTSSQLDSRNGGWDPAALAEAARAHLQWQREQDATDERYQRVLHAARWGRNCGECGRELTPDETVHRRAYQRDTITFLRERVTQVFAVAPTCVTCAVTTKGHRSVGRLHQVTVRCQGCGRPLVTGMDTVRRHPVCSTECLYRWRKAERAKWSVKPKRACETCGEAFRPKRADGRYCSPACRQKAYRQRKAAASVHPGCKAAGQEKPAETRSSSPEGDW